MTSMSSHQWRILVVMGALVAVTFIDFFGIAILLPTIGEEMHASGSEVQWIVNAYGITFAAPLIAFGRAADLYGHRKIAIWGTILYIAGALAVALTPSIDVLIAARAVQGIGTSMVCVTAYSIVGSMVPARQHAHAFGVIGGIGIAGGALGPILAGALTDFVSWRALFYAIAIIMTVGLASLFILLRNWKHEFREQQLDIPGVILLTASLVFVLLALQYLEHESWRSRQFMGCVVASVIALVAFCAVERIVKNPLIDFSLFNDLNFSGACALVFLSYFPFGALMFFVSIYLQNVLGYNAFETGIIYLALMIPILTISLLSGNIARLVGTRQGLVLSGAIMIMGFVAFGFVHPEAGLTMVLVGLVLVGLGRGVLFALSSTAALTSISVDKSGAAVGVLSTIRNISIPLGVAASGALIRIWENDRLQRLYNLAGTNLDADAQKEISALLSGSDKARQALINYTPELVDRIHLVIDHAMTHAIRNLMFLSIITCLFAILCTFLLKRSIAGDADTRESGAESLEK